jgi:U3 small nucleolar RNA-associated protein 14
LNPPILYPKLIQSLASQGQPTKRPKQGPSATKTVHFEVNLDENDEGELEDGPSGTGGPESEVEEEGEPDEFFDVLDILDGRVDLLSDEEPPTAPSREEQTSRASSDGDEEEEEADDDGDDQDMDHEPGDQLIPSDDEADIGALQNLGQFISNLDPSAKRKASEDQDAAAAEVNAPRKKRKLLKERNEAGAENEFAASGKLEFGLCSVPLYSDNCTP